MRTYSIRLTEGGLPTWKHRLQKDRLLPRLYTVEDPLWSSNFARLEVRSWRKEVYRTNILGVVYFEGNCDSLTILLDLTPHINLVKHGLKFKIVREASVGQSDTRDMSSYYVYLHQGHRTKIIHRKVCKSSYLLCCLRIHV